MPLPSGRAALTIAWRARHLLLGPWERLEAPRGTFAFGVGSLVGSLLLGATTVLALLVALLIEPWRAPALWTALAAALLALCSFALGLWLLLVLLPRRVRDAIRWLANTPANVEEGAAEFRAIVDDALRRERSR